MCVPVLVQSMSTHLSHGVGFACGQDLLAIYVCASSSRCVHRVSLRTGFACHLCACQFFKVCSQVSVLEQALHAIYVHACSSRYVHRFQS